MVIKIAAILILALILVAWLNEHRGRPRIGAAYIPAGYDRTPREWYEVHKEGADILIAAAYAEQRKSGRWLGPTIVVDWHPGQDLEIDSHALEIEQHGAACGVFVRRVGDGQPLIKRTRLP